MSVAVKREREINEFLDIIGQGNSKTHKACSSTGSKLVNSFNNEQTKDSFDNKGVIATELLAVEVLSDDANDSNDANDTFHSGFGRSFFKAGFGTYGSVTFHRHPLTNEVVAIKTLVAVSRLHFSSAF